MSMPALPRGRVKVRPEDFVVEEIAAYPASGVGEHVLVRLTKRDLTTLDVARTLARALGCDPREVGIAGMKDKRAVATQTISLHAPRGVAAHELADRARSLSLDGIVVHDATPHGHKIKAGHLAGNRFAIDVRDVPLARVGEVTAGLERLAREGVPNAFGPQRYGVAGDNATRALAWLRGQERGPREPRLQRLLWSSLQSAVFDAVLEARRADGTWATPLDGDVLKLHSSGGLFVCADVRTDGERALAGELSPTGPVVGARVQWAEGRAGEIERRTADDVLGPGFDLTRTRRLGEGTRRALRIWIRELRWEVTEGTVGEGPREAIGEPRGHGTACVRVYFVLPKGAYATTVLGAVVCLTESTHDRDDAAPEGNDREESGALE
ncbi:MAG: tRNA pseudouridine(13) synthase TruD [Myxococcota bacterium]|nr:tRNA pseudouridine(13) synthase TruD [Myxococcota bacterium]